MRGAAMKRVGALAVALGGSWFCLAPASLSAASQRGRNIIDDLGRQVNLPAEIRRIVSLVPSNSEMVCLLDCARLKGATRHDRFPEELVKRVEEKKVEIIGGGFDPNLEKIVEIGPDLILADGPSQQRVVKPLKRMGYAVLSLWPKDIDGIKKNFLLLAALLHREARAREMLSALDAGLGALRKKTAPRRKKRVYLQTWPEPLMTVGKDSFSQRLLSIAGGINVFRDMPFSSGKISLEWILERNPEVLIFVSPQEAFARRISTRPEWMEIEGVKRNHICFVDSADLRATIRFIDGAEKIYQCLFETAPTPR